MGFVDENDGIKQIEGQLAKLSSSISDKQEKFNKMLDDEIQSKFFPRQVRLLSEIDEGQTQLITLLGSEMDLLKRRIQELEASSAQEEIEEVPEPEEEEETEPIQPQMTPVQVIQPQPVMIPQQIQQPSGILPMAKIRDVRNLTNGQKMQASEMYGRGTSIPDIRDFFNLYSDVIARKAVDQGKELRKLTQEPEKSNS